MARARAELMRNDCARVRVPVAFWSLEFKNTMRRLVDNRGPVQPAHMRRLNRASLSIYARKSIFSPNGTMDENEKNI